MFFRCISGCLIYLFHFQDIFFRVELYRTTNIPDKRTLNKSGPGSRKKYIGAMITSICEMVYNMKAQFPELPHPCCSCYSQSIDQGSYSKVRRLRIQELFHTRIS